MGMKDEDLNNKVLPVVSTPPCPFCKSVTRIETTTFGDDMTEYYRVSCVKDGYHTLDKWDGTVEEAIESFTPSIDKDEELPIWKNVDDLFAEYEAIVKNRQEESKNAESNLLEKLNTISLFEKNWDTYGAEPPSKDAIVIAKYLIKEFCSLTVCPDEIKPVSNDGIVLEFKKTDDRYFWIHVYNDCDIIFLKSENYETETEDITTQIGRSNLIYLCEKILSD